MGSSIGFFCGPADEQALNGFLGSIGLRMVPTSIENAVSEHAEQTPFCFLSLLPLEQLHPYGKPPVRLTYARDPLLGYTRSFFKNPYLVGGSIQWFDDSPVFGPQTKPYYREITKWIQQNWTKAPEGAYHYGPEAQTLTGKGAQEVAALPGHADFKLIVL